MTELPKLTPTTDYPITVTPAQAHITVRVGGEVIAETDDALMLQEAQLPGMVYIPLSDVAGDRLTRTDTTTYCPFKGHAGYYSVTTGDGETVSDACWFYDEPFPAVAPIAGHVAFYPDKADIDFAVC